VSILSCQLGLVVPSVAKPLRRLLSLWLSAIRSAHAYFPYDCLLLKVRMRTSVWLSAIQSAHASCRLFFNFYLISVLSTGRNFCRKMQQWPRKNISGKIRSPKISWLFLLLCLKESLHTLIKSAFIEKIVCGRIFLSAAEFFHSTCRKPLPGIGNTVSL
jgi:hypothetical protein